MPNTTRQEILRYWKQADHDLERFLENLQLMEAIFDQADKEYPGRYDNYLASITGFAQIVIKTQTAWRKFRHEQL
jgi:hypothetical protein